jgi:uncharacterized protein (DUF2141 family)
MPFARTLGSPKVNSSPSLAWALGAILLGTVLGVPVRAQHPNVRVAPNSAAKLASVTPPVISSINPSTGPTTGGTAITITGSNFVVGATAVQFGANSAAGVSCSSVTTCTATSPAGSGMVDVRLTTASGTSTDSSVDTFTYTAVPAANCATFSGPTDFEAGSIPISVTTGDFNGDGISDLAVANQTSGGAHGDVVAILLGNSDGTFGAATYLTVGSFSVSVVTGDFNADGKLDLAVANYGSNDVSILLGTGTGTFGAATNFGAGTNPEKVIVGDFNGDGKLDLAVANLNGNDVSILLGTGTGTFGAATNFAVEMAPFSVAIGDLNGDGKLDLAVANQDSGGVSILLGTGTGTFGAATNFAFAAKPKSVAIGDFNGDGKLDLAVANFASNCVSILLGTGTGSFGAATNFAVGSAPFSVAIGDVNGDGKLDLAVANLNSDNVSILLGTGTGTFGTATNFPAGSGPLSVAIRDFNGDGKLDLAVANTHSGDVSILLNAGCTSGAVNFFLLTPCRVLDTRGGARVPANGVMNLVVTEKCGVAAGATAIAANVTAVSPSVEGLVTIYPGPANSVKPVVSTINYTAGRTLANNARITVGVDGSINLFNAAGTPLDFLIDVAGYFK